MFSAWRPSKLLPVRALPSAVGALAVLLAGGLLAPTAPGIAVTDAASGNILLCRPLPPPARAALVFTHSIYGGDVVEEFVAPDRHTLRRVAMTTASAAAAEYYAPNGNVLPAGDRFLVDVPDLDLSELAVRVDRIGAHRVRLADTTLDLVAAAGDRRRVWLRPATTTIAARLFGAGC